MMKNNRILAGSVISFSLLVSVGMGSARASPRPSDGRLLVRTRNDEALQRSCEKLMSAKRSIFYLTARSYRMALQLRSVYTRDETIFFCLGLSNHSHMDYPIDSIRFFLAEEKQAGKGTLKGNPLTPLYVCGNTRMIRGKTRELYVFAMPRFTLDAKKVLVIDVSEHNGGRHLRLLAGNYTLVKARLL